MFRFGSPVQPMVSIDRSIILHVLFDYSTVSTLPADTPHSLIFGRLVSAGIPIEPLS